MDTSVEQGASTYMDKGREDSEKEKVLSGKVIKVATWLKLGTIEKAV